MNQPQNFERSAEDQRTVDDKIARLRNRVKQAAQLNPELRGLLLGILDLLDDEL